MSPQPVIPLQERLLRPRFPLFRPRLSGLRVGAAALTAVLLLAACNRQPPASAPGRWGGGPGGERPPTPVRVAPAQQAELTLRLKALGTVTPLNTVTLRPRVQGELVRIAFAEGQEVEAGQLLAEIDPEPFRIRLAQAVGQQQQNLAELDNARRQLQRYTDLQAGNYVSAQDLSDQQARVRQLEGRRDSDQAAVDEARLQLQYTRITAPVAGRVGLRAVDVGNLVDTNDGIVTITQTRPISVLFTIPEQELPAVIAASRSGATLAVEAWDRSDARILARGTLASVDNRIDTDTGTLRLRALFANADDSLFPNQFVNVRMDVSRENSLLIPDAAVQFGNAGAYVYVVDDDSIAHVRKLTLGASDGGRIAVLDGLAPGEQVVLEGIDRLTDGGLAEIVADANSARAD